MTDRPRALAVLITVFLLGCIIGSAGFYYWFGRSQEIPDVPAASGRGEPPQMPERPKLPDLQLTPEQEERFREIMAESRKQTQPLIIERQEMEKELRARQGPEFNEIWAETNRKFRDILTEEQKTQYDAFWKEREEIWKEREEIRKRPPRGRGFESRGRGNSKPPQ